MKYAKKIKSLARAHNEAIASLYSQAREVDRDLREKLGSTLRVSGVDIAITLANQPGIEAEVERICRRAVVLNSYLEEATNALTDIDRGALSHIEQATMVVELPMEKADVLAKIRKQHIPDGCGLAAGVDLAIEILKTGSETIYDPDAVEKLLPQHGGNHGGVYIPPIQSAPVSQADLEGALWGAIAGAIAGGVSTGGAGILPGALGGAAGSAVVYSLQAAWEHYVKPWAGWANVIHGPLDPNGPIYWPTGPVSGDNRVPNV